MMYIPIEVIITIIWIALGIFCAFKQYKVNPKDPVWWIALIVSPVWFIGAFIRQLIWEEWK